MLTIILALLMSYGIIDNPIDYHNASAQQQEMYREIIIDDLDGV